MTKPCARLSSSNTEAYKLCRFLVHKRTTDGKPLQQATIKTVIQQIDKGVPYIRFRHVTSDKARPRRAIGTETKGNGLLESGEVYAHVLRLLENDHAGKLTSLWKHVAGIKSFRPPWILDDFDPKTSHDKKLVLAMKAEITKIKAELVCAKLTPNTVTFNTALAKKLIAFVVRTKSKGGLGVTPLSIDPTDFERERSALAVLATKDRKAHCTELNYIFYPLFLMAGLKPTFRLVYKDQWDIVSLSHVCMGIQLDPAKPNAVTLVDLTNTSKAKWFNTSHKVTLAMPRTMTLSIYYSNLGIALDQKANELMKIPQKIKQKIKTLYLKGYAYDPLNPILSHNLANYYRLTVTDKRLRDRYLKGALTLYPNYEDALTLQKFIKNPNAPVRRPTSLRGLYE